MSTPPRAGPAAEPSGPTVAITPNARPRTSGATASTAITGSSANKAAANTPWATRAPITQPNQGAAPTSTLAAANPVTRETMAARLPTWSSQRPLGSDSAISGSR